MNSRSFRRNQGPKAKSTFISLHFNKSDEEQLEISYKKGAEETPPLKNAQDASQSHFFVADSEKTSQEEKNLKSSAHPSVHGILSEEDLFAGAQSSNAPKSDAEDVVDFQRISDLSPAIEADEVGGSDTFSHYINDQLEKAKCDLLDSKKDASPEPVRDPLCLTDPATDSKSTDRTDCDRAPDQGDSYFSCVVRNSVALLRYAQNSVTFHLFVALLAFVCAPLPSWLSGFLVGTLLSSSLVYWLYKPSKKRRNVYCVSPSIAYASHFQEESGILKGWMNELPSSFPSYSADRYHVSCTRSVYVRLEGSYLRFSFPLKNVPKRAMFNEPRYEMQFVHQQHYDITGATIQLLPQGLSKKRLWSKKYPICLRIPNTKGAVLSPGNSATRKDKFLPRIDENNEIVIYLFSRTDRDKSLWYSRFVKASRTKLEQRSHSPTPSLRLTEQQSFENKRTLSVDFAQLQNSLLEEGEDEDEADFVKLSLSKQQKFEMYMGALLAPLHPAVATLSPKSTPEKSSSLTWLNVLIGRLFFDFLVEDIWAQLVSEKIQKKLNRIKLPFFLSELSVRDIHLGSALPKVHHASDPCVDERGLWVDLDLSYNGTFHMTLETKLNLQRFKSDSELTLFTDDQAKSPELCESDEDSLESSSDDESLFPNAANEDALKDGGNSTSKRLMKLMDKLAQSSYFQHAAKNRYVKRCMDDLSNTPLVLTVEVQWLTGTLALNIPPWPTDRLWYGFRGNPSLSITARPMLGQHAVTFTHVTEWIEKKLTSEFQKVLVLPNMDDLIIPIMHSALDAS